jgi:hypothetical protein
MTDARNGGKTDFCEALNTGDGQLTKRCAASRVDPAPTPALKPMADNSVALQNTISEDVDGT